MSITNGLSSNNTRSQQNPLQLDANTRAGIQAQNQARLLQSIGVIKNDEFVGGGGLNPLKNLYSAAAASFLKNKRGGDAQPGVKKPGQAQEQSANALSTLAASSASSPSISFQQKNARVGGPASGANYKKYAWDGKPGPTGSDNTVEPTPADDPADPVDPSGQPADPGPAAPADFTKVISSFKKVVEDADGGFADNNDGSYQFKVMDIRGDMKQDGNLLVGSVSADSGTYTFTIQADGSVKLDASKGNTASAEFDQLKRLLDGNLSGARRVQTDPPAEPAPPADSGGTGGTGDTGGTGGTGAAAATPPPPVDTEADDSLVGALTKSASDLLTLAGTGKSSSRGRYNARLMIDDIKAAGGTVTMKDSNTLNITLNGQTGTLTLKDDTLKGGLGTGKAAIQFEIRGNGDTDIHGENRNVQAYTNSVNLRKALGATVTARTEWRGRIVAFNRYGTGLGLNLLA